MEYGNVWKDLLVSNRHRHKYHQVTVEFDQYPKNPTLEQLNQRLEKTRKSTLSPSYQTKKQDLEERELKIVIPNKASNKNEVSQDFKKRLIQASESDFNARRIIKALKIES